MVDKSKAVFVNDRGENVDNEEFEGIVYHDIPTAAGKMVDCFTASEILDEKALFHRHVENAKRMGLMLDDMKVVKRTLADMGFTMQSSYLEGIRIKELIERIGLLDPEAIILVLDSNIKDMLLLKSYGYKYRILYPHESEQDILYRRSNHVWIHYWKDGKDISPYKRRNISREIKVKTRQAVEDNDFYRFFQPNPCGNCIGDCVIRAFAGALDITWEEAMDKLASLGNTTVNSPDNFAVILEKEGFVHHEAIIKKGRKMKAPVFCFEMDNTYHHRERIFAYLGRNHVAAIVPTGDDRRYRIIDSWNSTKRTVGEYWVKDVRKKRETQITDTTGVPIESIAVGDTIIHPVFGKGIVREIDSKMVTIDFEEKGIRRLSINWIREKCTHISKENVVK